MAYAVGHISGGHFNPAVTVGVFSAGRIPAKDIGPYVVAQLAGAIAGASILYLIASGKGRIQCERRFLQQMVMERILRVVTP